MRSGNRAVIPPICTWFDHSIWTHLSWFSNLLLAFYSFRDKCRHISRMHKFSNVGAGLVFARWIPTWFDHSIWMDSWCLSKLLVDCYSWIHSLVLTRAEASLNTSLVVTLIIPNTFARCIFVVDWGDDNLLWGGRISWVAVGRLGNFWC